jgi:hypothetical protein
MGGDDDLVALDTVFGRAWAAERLPGRAARVALSRRRWWRGTAFAGVGSTSAVVALADDDDVAFADRHLGAFFRVADVRRPFPTTAVVMDIMGSFPFAGLLTKNR